MPIGFSIKSYRPNDSIEWPTETRWGIENPVPMEYIKDTYVETGLILAMHTSKSLDGLTLETLWIFKDQDALTAFNSDSVIFDYVRLRNSYSRQFGIFQTTSSDDNPDLTLDFNQFSRLT